MVNNFHYKKQGVAILFAVLLVSVVLTISLGLFNIAYRQLVLSSLARESEIAMSVADTARNCALYWNSPERAKHPFGYFSYTSGNWTWHDPDPGAGDYSITCAGAPRPVQTLTVNTVPGDSGGGLNPGDLNDYYQIIGGDTSPTGIDSSYIDQIYQSINGSFNSLNNVNAVGAAGSGGNSGSQSAGPSSGSGSLFWRHFSAVITVGTGSGSREACADVLVAKSKDSGQQRTTITANGYNSASANSNPYDCTPTDINRAVQRTIVTVING